MKNRRVEIQIGKTINLGDFESVRVDIGLSEDISEKDILEDSFDSVFEDVNVKLDEYCEELNEKHTNKSKRLRKIRRNE